jgi:hypothetical protein
VLTTIKVILLNGKIKFGRYKIVAPFFNDLNE